MIDIGLTSVQASIGALVMSQGTQNDPISELGERIEAAKKAQDPEVKMDEHYSNAQTAWRMVIELVTGLGIGFGIGYGLDYLFGTIPLFLVLFIFLGFAAGVKTMINTAKEIQTRQMVDMTKDE